MKEFVFFVPWLAAKYVRIQIYVRHAQKGCQKKTGHASVQMEGTFLKILHANPVQSSIASNARMELMMNVKSA